MSDAFFHRPSTHKLIADLSEVQDWTIYVGLGATIDRTGISWAKLVDALMSSFIDDRGLRSLIVEEHGEIRSATIARSLFRTRYGKAAFKSRISNAIGDLLYGPHQNMAGRLLESIAMFSLAVRAKGGSVALVTPNYDDYLHREMESAAVLTPDADLFVHGDVRISLHVAGTVTEPLPKDWRLERTQVHCMYLHGYVSSLPEQSQGEPVISETDYAESHDRTVGILTEMFQDRNVLIVGSSVTDPPLVDALLADSARSEHERREFKRIAVMPIQGARWIGRSNEERDALEEWDSRRLKELGVEAVRPDFYIQSAQLLMEIHRAVSANIGEQMTQPVSPHRYGSRLSEWWASWFKDNCSDVKLTQAAHHEALAAALTSVRSLISAPPEESLKLEIWIRWNPHETRELRLWASSVGTWPDIRSMRYGQIESGSRYKSVRVFCQGSPTFLHELDESTERWKSYFGIPIWLRDIGVPVAVVTLASMLPPGESSVAESNLGALREAILIMASEARRLVTLRPEIL